MDDESISSETVIRCNRKRMVWWHPIINGKNRHSNFFSPLTGKDLHGSAWESDKTTTMQVNYDTIDIFNLIFLVKTTTFFLQKWIFYQLNVWDDSNNHRVLPRFKNIHILANNSIDRQVNLHFWLNTLIFHVNKMFGGAHLRHVPDVLGNFQSGRTIKCKTSEFRRIIHHHIFEKWCSKPQFLDETILMLKLI